MNRLSEAVKFLLLSATILITCTLISLGFLILKQGQTYGTVIAKNIDDHTRELYESDIMKYDGLKVSGSDVINFIKKNLSSYSSTETGGYTIRVITNKRTTSHTNRTYIALISNFSSDYYIKPTAEFLGEVEKNQNGVIIQVQFKQQ